MMKKLLSILLAAIMLLTCVPALAEENPTDTVFFEELGVTLDLAAIREKCTNSFRLESDGVLSHDPYAALSIVIYYAIPQQMLDQIISDYGQASEEDKLTYTQLIQSLAAYAAFIIVSDAPDQAAMIDALGLKVGNGVEVSEVATKDSWRCYFVKLPVDDLLALYDDPELIDGEYTEEMARADQEAIRTDVELIQSALMQQLQTGEWVEPVDPSDRLIGQTLEFETTDLDGNPVKSADLFKDNRITMVNVWGSWCVNCINEMAKLAQLHHRLQEKGCGIVGLEFEQKPIEAVADTARAVMTANGTTYPNAIKPKGNPILDQFNSYPTTLFVDSEGRILTYPIIGAAVAKYEPTVEALLAGESADVVTGTGAVANGDNKYCVYVYDPDGNPVEGVFIQFCDDTTCSFQPTDANGRAEFSTDVEKAYEVHVLQAPEGYRQDERAYETLDSYSDVNIFLERAE
ncbi:MAG: redoxin domain-containing protein [Clostridia bacterium]|nr:redoxin domain-containing protein [Clostridia bacterium]